MEKALVKCSKCGTEVECIDGLVPLSCWPVLSKYTVPDKDTKVVGYGHGLGRPGRLVWQTEQNGS